MHPPDARHDGGEGAHDGDELGQGDGLAAVAAEEVARALHVLLLEQARVGPVEDGRARLAADEVAGLVAGDRRQPHQRGRDPDVDGHALGGVGLAHGHEHAQREQQGVPGQEEAHQQARLGEDDEHDAEDGPGADPADEGGDDVGGVQPLGAEHGQGRGGRGRGRHSGCGGDEGDHGARVGRNGATRRGAGTHLGCAIGHVRARLRPRRRSRTGWWGPRP